MKKSDILDKQLFWEKYRPIDIKDIIVPNRIKKIAEAGIQGNYIFHGNSGCGKSSLARILLKEYPNSHIILSSKLGVDELRTRVDRFCREMIPFEDPDKLRVVYFEEFDRASSQLQDELKSFIEDHSKRVRFLATCNNITKIKEPIRSRFIEVDFTPYGDETKELKTGFAKRVIDICKKENINIDKDILKDIVNKRFPDFRKSWQDIQHYHLTGINSSIKNVDDKDIGLFNLILNKKNTVANWEYLYVNWMDNPDLAFQKLGRDFFNFIKDNYPGKTDKLAMTIITVSDYTDLRLPNASDPFVTLCALVFKLQEIYN
jgi:DNA polymerase III delta prime subunit